MDTVIQVDSREKNNQHILEYFEANNIKYVDSKLYVGDYMNWDNTRLVIERKNSILELVCTIGKYHNRFKSELTNATKIGIHIILLVEENGYNNIEDLKKWNNPFKSKNSRAMTGETVYKILKKYTECYNIEIQFTTKYQAGAKILSLLTSGS